MAKLKHHVLIALMIDIDAADLSKYLTNDFAEVQHCLPWTNRLKSIVAYSINHKPRPTSRMSFSDMLKLKMELLHIIIKYMNYELNNFVKFQHDHC